MTTLREAAQQALEALTSRDGDGWTRRFARDRAIEALEAALADGDNLSPTEPEPLTYEQLAKLGNDIVCLWDPPKWGMSELWEASLVEFGRAVEAAHGINAPSPGSDGCDHCRHPLYAAIKCSQCGRVTE